MAAKKRPPKKKPKKPGGPVNLPRPIGPKAPKEPKPIPLPKRKR